MPSNIWTQGALLSSARDLAGRCWRVVEAQSLVSAMKLSDTVEEQEAIERLIEETEPQIPKECRHLGFLLFTPFRHGSYPFDSRFRRAGSTAGVFYAAEAVETAIAEAVFHRLLFFLESPRTPWPTNPGEHTAFAVEYAARGLDLTRPPLAAGRILWTHPTDYAACLDLADACRAAGLQAIRYESVRDPASRANVALLTCRAFTQSDTVDRQTWRLHFSSSGIRAVREFPTRTVPFTRTAFSADPHMAAMQWDR
jgi:RES domain-containing protein